MKKMLLIFSIIILVLVWINLSYSKMDMSLGLHLDSTGTGTGACNGYDELIGADEVAIKDSEGESICCQS